MSKIFFITLCDNDGPKVENLKKSLNQEIIVLPTYDREIKNLSKIFKIQEYLSTASQIGDNDVIVFVDAHDVVWIDKTRTKEDFMNDFIKTGKEIIISAEMSFAHHLPITRPYFDEKYRGCFMKYLNSGMTIAYKAAYLKMLNYIVENFEAKYRTVNNTSDQRVISKFMVDNEELKLVSMDLDHKPYFCTTISNMHYNDPTRIKTYLVHVTWLSNKMQLDRYQKIIKHFNI